MKTGRSNLITLVFHVQFFFLLTPEILKKIHILAAPQYKPQADFHKIKVAAYFPNLTVTYFSYKY